MSFSPFDGASLPCYTPTSLFGQTRKHRVVEEAVVKPTMGMLIGWVLHNSGYGDQHLSFYDQRQQSVSSGDIVDWRLILAPGETSMAEFAMGIPFYNSIAYLQTGAITGVLLYA